MNITLGLSKNKGVKKPWRNRQAFQRRKWNGYLQRHTGKINTDRINADQINTDQINTDQINTDMSSADMTSPESTTANRAGHQKKRAYCLRNMPFRKKSEKLSRPAEGG